MEIVFPPSSPGSCSRSGTRPRSTCQFMFMLMFRKKRKNTSFVSAFATDFSDMEPYN